MLFETIHRAVSLVLPHVPATDVTLLRDRLIGQTKTRLAFIGVVAVAYPVLTHTFVKKFSMTTKDWLVQTVATWRLEHAPKRPTKEEQDAGVEVPVTLRIADGIVEHHRSTKAEFGAAVVKVCMQQYRAVLWRSVVSSAVVLVGEVAVFAAVGCLTELAARDALPAWGRAVATAPLGFTSLYDFLLGFVLISPSEMFRIPVIGSMLRLGAKWNRWLNGLTLMPWGEYKATVATFGPAQLAAWTLLGRLRSFSFMSLHDLCQTQATVHSVELLVSHMCTRLLNTIAAVSAVYFVCSWRALDSLAGFVERHVFAGRGVPFAVSCLLTPLLYVLDKSFKATT